jgi:hypothetical protein
MAMITRKRGEDEGEEDEEDQQNNENAGGMGHDAHNVDNNMEWIDAFILETRRKGGRQTETPVLKTYKVGNHRLGSSA